MVQFEYPGHPNPSVSSNFGVGRISLFPLLALWGNKNWPPSMKVKKLKIFQDKMGSMGCKWSSLNAPGTQSPLSHPILKLDEFPFLKRGGSKWIFPGLFWMLGNYLASVIWLVEMGRDEALGLAEHRINWVFIQIMVAKDGSDPKFKLGTQNGSACHLLSNFKGQFNF